MQKYFSNLEENSWLTALFGAILPFKDKTQIPKSCLRAVSEVLVKLIQTM